MTEFEPIVSQFRESLAKLGGVMTEFEPVVSE